MRYFIAALAPLFIMLCSVLTLAAAHPVAEGLIILPGYEHAIVLCGEGTVINPGHEADIQVTELQALAAEMCPAQ
jgi:hypothetical protein